MTASMAMKALFWQTSDVGRTIFKPAREYSRVSSLELRHLIKDRLFLRSKKKYLILTEYKVYLVNTD